MNDSVSLLASVIIVSFNDEDLIADCLTSVLDQDIPIDRYEVIVVDNDSKDRTVEIICEQFPHVVLIESKTNLGYPAGMNKGLEFAHAPRVVMLSSDTVVPHTWLSSLMRPMDEDSAIKVTHSAMVIPGDPGYHEGLASRVMPENAAYHELSRLGLVEPHWVSTSSAPIPTLHIAGASAALEISILPEIGGYMLEGDYFLDCDEIDLGFRVNSLGYKVMAVPAAAYYHRHPFNISMKLTRKLVARLIRLERNKAITFYKNMHTLEFLACLPILLFGGALKPLVYADRFSTVQLIINILGLELFVWLGFLVALFGHFPKFSNKRQISLRNRRQPQFWFLRQFLSRSALERSHV